MNHYQILHKSLWVVGKTKIRIGGDATRSAWDKKLKKSCQKNAKNIVWRTVAIDKTVGPVTMWRRIQPAVTISTSETNFMPTLLRSIILMYLFFKKRSQQNNTISCFFLLKWTRNEQFVLVDDDVNFICFGLNLIQCVHKVRNKFD